MSGFVYPNEVLVEWDLLIVIYPYITGLVAGSFIVSSLYHVFGLTRLKPVARFSLITALAFLLVSPLPLLAHLGQPQRALEIFLRPNLTSAMSGFGYIWFLYLLIVIAEVWLVFRPDIVRRASSSQGTKKTIYSALSLGVSDLSEKSLSIDRKLIKALALIGIPAASLLHGYVGFIFGAVKANAWWTTPLMPIIFLLSAVVSGIALLMVLYAVVTRIRKEQLDRECFHSLALWLGGFLTLALALEGLEVLSMAYESDESWPAVSRLITEKIPITYLGVQLGMGSMLPLLILGIPEVVRLGEQTKTTLRFASAVLVLIGVFAMRWNVVIGGQLVSKSLRGFTSYSPTLTGQGGILMTLGILSLPFIVLAVLAYLLPPWQEKVEPPRRRKLSF